MSNPTVAFDESGNTGQNLLDPAQPVFTLASIHLSDDELEYLDELVDWPEDGELHFTDLKRSARGRRRIRRILTSDVATPEHVKVFVIHKRFMVVAKVVELLEDLTHRTGSDLYERGANIALSNLLYFCTPTFCGQEHFEEFLEAFVGMIRNPNELRRDHFYRRLRDLSVECRDEQFRSGVLKMLGATRVVVDDLLANATTWAIDPAVPAFLVLGTEWDAQLDREWDIVHDQSKPIEHAEEILECFLGAEEPGRLVGHDRRKARLPLRAAGIDLCSSQKVREIQVADIFAGAIGQFATGAEDKSQRDQLWHEFREMSLLETVYVDAVWPQLEMDPQALGTDETGGRSLHDHAADLVGRGMREKYGRNWARKYQSG